MQIWVKRALLGENGVAAAPWRRTHINLSYLKTFEGNFPQRCTFLSEYSCFHEKADLELKSADFTRMCYLGEIRDFRDFDLQNH